MLQSFIRVLGTQGGSRAVGGFTAYDLTTGEAVLRVAEQRDTSVILIVSAQAYSAPTGSALVTGLLRLADDASVPVCVQLDHVTDLGLIERALRAGIGAIMADGSQLPYSENVALVREVVRLADATGAGVEAELGRIEGDEEIARAADTGALTDPDEAVEFMKDTGAHCLAVSIGNVHGTYSRPPRLDWDRLRAICKAVRCPLSLHGASGLKDHMMREAVRLGIVKVNVNTELRARWFGVVASRASVLAEGSNLLGLQRELGAALGDIVEAKLEILAPSEPTTPAGPRTRSR